MAKRTTFMEKASEDGKAVWAGGGTVDQRDTNADVVSKRSGLPRAEETASVKIKVANGRIKEERAYPHRSDPCRTRVSP